MKLPKIYFVLWILFIAFGRRIRSRNENVFNKHLKFLEGIDFLSLVVGHPDDEVMFFAPTLLELDSKLPEHVQFNVICLSNGGADGMGDIRVQELEASVNLLLANSRRPRRLYQYNYTDGHDEVWDQKSVQSSIKESVLDNKGTNALLTFDNRGVSGHVNHIACHDAVSKLLQDEANVKAALYLDSYAGNILLKYSAFFWEIWKLVGDWLVNHSLSTLWYSNNKDDISTNITFMNDYASYILSLACMLHSHKSQMAWFRYGWWTFSRFVFVNDLIVISK